MSVDLMPDECITNKNTINVWANAHRLGSITQTQGHTQTPARVHDGALLHLELHHCSKRQTKQPSLK